MTAKQLSHTMAVYDQLEQRHTITICTYSNHFTIKLALKITLWLMSYYRPLFRGKRPIDELHTNLLTNNFSQRPLTWKIAIIDVMDRTYG